MEQLNFTITGMSCGHCVAAVREALDEMPGVTVEAVTVGSAAVAYDPARTTPERIAAAVADAGYAARPAGAPRA